MRNTFMFLISLTLLSCNAHQSNTKPIDTSKYSVFFHDKRDGNAVFSERIVLTKAMPKDTLITLLKERLDYATANFPQATRTFVYVYKTKEDYYKEGLNWVGMLYHTNTNKGEIKIKLDLDPLNPPVKAEHIDL